MPYASVVVGTDGSDTAEQAVRAAAEVAGSHGARLLIVVAYDAGAPAPATGGDRAEAAAEPRALAEEAAGRGLALAQETVTLQAEVRAEAGPAADVLLAAAEAAGADLVVVGSRGMTGAARLTIGAVAGTISHHATCDVLIVHTTG